MVQAQVVRSLLGTRFHARILLQPLENNQLYLIVVPLTISLAPV
jgi:hypothetical protein